MLCHRTRELRLSRTDQEFEKILISEKIESKIYVHHSILFNFPILPFLLVLDKHCVQVIFLLFSE